MSQWLWVVAIVVGVLMALTACVDPDDEDPLPKSGLDL